MRDFHIYIHYRNTFIIYARFHYKNTFVIYARFSYIHSLFMHVLYTRFNKLSGLCSSFTTTNRSHTNNYPFIHLSHCFPFIFTKNINTLLIFLFITPSKISSSHFILIYLLSFLFFSHINI